MSKYPKPTEEQIKQKLEYFLNRDDEDDGVYDMGSKEETIAYNSGFDRGVIAALEYVLGMQPFGNQRKG